MTRAAVIAAALVIAGTAGAQTLLPQEQWNPGWDLELNTNLTEYVATNTSWIAYDLWRAMDERTRALGPMEQQPGDTYGWNYTVHLTIVTGRTSTASSVTWTNAGGTAVVYVVTNWATHYGTVDVVNAFTPEEWTTAWEAAGGHASLLRDFLEQWDVQMLAILPSYVMPWYSTSPEYSYDGWFTLGTASTWPTNFPMSTKLDLFHKCADVIGGIATGTVAAAGDIGKVYPVETNQYGQATNGFGLIIKRKDRPMFLPLAEWKFDGTNWSGRTLHNGAGWAGSVPGDTVENTESRVDRNVMAGRPKWRLLPGGTNTVGPLTIDLVGIDLITTFMEANGILIDLGYTPLAATGIETITTDGQAADWPYTCVPYPEVATITGTAHRGDRLVLMWQESAFTTYEGTEAVDAELYKEALDARKRWIQNLTLTRVPDGNWNWTDGIWATNRTSTTNALVQETNVVSNLTWQACNLPTETHVAWWAPTGSCPYLDGFQFTEDLFAPFGSETNVAAASQAPSLTGRAVPYLYYGQIASFDRNEYCVSLTNAAHLTNDTLSYTLTATNLGISMIDVDNVQTQAALVADSIWTGRDSRVHFYLKSEWFMVRKELVDGATITNTFASSNTPIHRIIVSDWGRTGSVVTARLKAADELTPFEDTYIEGTCTVSVTDWNYDLHHTKWEPVTITYTNYSSRGTNFNEYTVDITTYYTDGPDGNPSDNSDCLEIWPQWVLPPDADHPHAIETTVDAGGGVTNHIWVSAPTYYGYANPAGSISIDATKRIEATQFDFAEYVYDAVLRAGPHLIEWRFMKP